MKKINIIDLTNKSVFPNEKYRFSRVIKNDNQIVLERDFIGENPLHYYLSSAPKEIIIANSIREIKDYIEKNGNRFLWEHARAISNNKRVVITSDTFYNQRPEVTELRPILQEMVSPTIDFSDMSKMGEILKKLFVRSIGERLASIQDKTTGLLLSGGLDSITTGFYLKNNSNSKKIRAFTLKVNENEPDITKAREVAKQLRIPITEVKISKNGDWIITDVEVYDEKRNLERKYNLSILNIETVVTETLKIAENPKKDNLFCSLAMYLIGQAIKNEKIKTVFCGEGPNEMINDYGFQPSKEGYPGMGISDTYFRQALTFGLKESDMQLGRGGLAKHALSRMGKIFAYYGIRLESPFFNSEIANILTKIPYPNKDYEIIKPQIDQRILGKKGSKILGSFKGISKAKFQDGSGISRIFKDYDQERLVGLFEEIYGANKESYIKK